MSFSRNIPMLLAWVVAVSAPTVLALESDRQQPLVVNANSTDGTLGDGVTFLRGEVVIRQGTLHIQADEAEVDKLDGKVRTVILRGTPAFMEQEVEEQGLVQAEAMTITYQVSSGLVTLEGQADVKHPQYHVSGDLLTYDLQAQHFQGTGDEQGNGRIRIRLDPEVLPDEQEEQESATEPDASDAPDELAPDEPS